MEMDGKMTFFTEKADLKYKILYIVYECVNSVCYSCFATHIPIK